MSSAQQPPKPIFATDVDYWKTGGSRTPDQWLDLAESQIRQHGGKDMVRAIGEQGGRKAYLIEFTLNGQRYKIVWPVLPLPRFKDTDDNRRAAERQAATSLFHDVKARCVAASRYGPEFGFFQFAKLPDGRTVQQASLPELEQGLPELMKGPERPLLQGPQP